MKKYDFECIDCSANCRVTVKSGDFPRYCPYEKERASWYEVERDTAQVAGLPDWVMELAIGYDNEQNRYFEVTNVDIKRVDIEYLDDGIGATCDYADIAKCSEARKRRLNDKEMKALVGRIMEHATGRYLITACTSFSTGDWKIEADGQYYSAALLLKDDFTIDGKPCYVLEHLENGEWVK